MLKKIRGCPRGLHVGALLRRVSIRGQGLVPQFMQDNKDEVFELLDELIAQEVAA